MRFFYLIASLLLGTLAQAQNRSTALFANDTIATIYLELPADSLAEIYGNPMVEIEHRTNFIYADGRVQDTLGDVAIRIRGNTSRNAAKKSFKISFNEFSAGRRYQGVKELNLIAAHNDPTLIRQKLFYDTWNAFGLPKRRVNFLKLYINGSYYGLYNNVEELDKIWLGRNFTNNTGNLYKCTYPADLAYRGTDQQTYKNLVSGTAIPERVYDLKTNETADDYSDLVTFITAINSTLQVFQSNIDPVLNVDNMLKALALDVATGNWDNYAYNKNNFFLYHNPSTGKMEFITYDTDNSFGIDWVNVDWATRSHINWGNVQHPLSHKLLRTPYFYQYQTYLLDSLTGKLLQPTHIFPYIDQLQQFIRPAVVPDTYRTLDWGYDMNDFDNGFIATVDNHTPYGIKPFLQKRYDRAFLDTQNNLPIKQYLKAAPNPIVDFCYIIAPKNISQPLFLYSIYGNLVRRFDAPNTDVFPIDLQSLPNGTYLLKTEGFEQGVKIMVIR